MNLLTRHLLEALVASVEAAALARRRAAEICQGQAAHEVLAALEPLDRLAEEARAVLERHLALDAVVEQCVRRLTLVDLEDVEARLTGEAGR